MRMSLYSSLAVCLVSAAVSGLSLAQTKTLPVQAKVNCSECMPGVDPPPPPPKKQLNDLQAVSNDNWRETLATKKKIEARQSDVKLEVDDKVFTRDLRSKHFSGRKP